MKVRTIECGGESSPERILAVTTRSILVSNKAAQTEPENTTEPYNASHHVTRGVTWAILMRWAVRLIGLFSTLILARILTPDDFGVAAMATIVVGLFVEMSELGTSSHLIRAKTVDRPHCDTAWSITLLQGIFVGCVLAALAHPASRYFHEPRIVSVLYVLAVVSVIGGLENIGPVLIRRELDFSRDFRFNVYKKILVFFATVGLAFYLRSYWALVLGQLTGTIASVALSYSIHSYRPKWSLEKLPEFISFGLAMVPLRIANTVLTAIPSFLVAGLNSTTMMGSYRVANDLSTTFTQEIVTPMGRGLLPNYVRMVDRPDQLSAMYKKVLGTVALLCIPIGAGAAAVAADLVAVLLGPKWGFSAELMQYLAIGAAIFAVSMTMNNQILVAMGRERKAAVLAWIRLAITAPILWLGLHYGGAIGLAKATIVAPLVCLPFIYNETRQAVILPLPALLGLLWRPLLAAFAMYVGVKALHPAQFDSALVRLVCDVSIGAIIFSLVSVATWLFSGRPDSAERLVLNYAAKVHTWARSEGERI